MYGSKEPDRLFGLGEQDFTHSITKGNPWFKFMMSYNDILDVSDLIPEAKFSYPKPTQSDQEVSDPRSYDTTPKTSYENLSEGSLMYPSITHLRTNFGKQRSPKVDYRSDDNVGVQTLNETPSKAPPTKYQLQAWKF